jgi:hypothetical protein
MIYKWLENLSKKKRVFYAYDSLIDAITELRKFDTAKWGWIGSFSVSSKRCKVYKVNEPLLVWEGVELIATEIAKLLLMLNRPPCGFRKITAHQLDETPPPLYACPWKGEAIYLDIKSCYYHLIERLYGIRYARNYWLARDKEIPTWHVPENFEAVLREYKEIRNAIYGLMRAKVRTVWKIENEKITFTVQRTKNNLFYPDVPLAILDITHAISIIAVEVFHAKYVAIDGFILPYKHAEPFYQWLEELGFRVGVRAEGWTQVKNFYSYTIGDKKTKTFDKYSTADKIQSNLFLKLDEAYEILKKFKPFLKLSPKG